MADSEDTVREASLSGIFEAIPDNLPEEIRRQLPNSRPAAPPPSNELVSIPKLLTQAVEMQRRLAAVAQRLTSDPDDKNLSDAHAVLAEASELRIPETSAFSSIREKLLEAFFKLDQLVKRTTRAAAAPPPARSAAPAPATPTEKPKPSPKREEQRAPNRRKIVVLVVIAVVAGGARFAYYFAAERGDGEVRIVEEGKKAGATSTTTTVRRSKQEDINRGAPVVTDLRLEVTNNGLRAIAAAIDLNSPSPKLSFRWFKNDQVLVVEDTGRLADVEPHATYRVEVTATDGALTSAPLKSGPILIKPPQ